MSVVDSAGGRYHGRMVAETLLREIVDYAGLFPPASLAFDQVLANYAQYRRSDQRWMLGRLIVPVGRLAEMSVVPASDRVTGDRWSISCLVPSPQESAEVWRESLDAIARFHRSHGSWAVVDALETKVDQAGTIARFHHEVDESMNVFWELPLDDRLPGLIGELASVARPNRYAKVRTGGVTAAAIPAPEAVARFIRTCGDWGVGWKATAGLHHPLRGSYPLTYQPASDCGVMYGFLNVFLAAALNQCYRPAEPVLVALLTEERFDAFVWTDHSVRWRDWPLDEAQLQSMRRHVVLSFGSCSFTEPVEEWQALWNQPQRQPRVGVS